MGDLIKVDFRKKKEGERKKILREISDLQKEHKMLFTTILSRKYPEVFTTDLSLLIVSLTHYKRVDILNDLLKLLNQIVLAYNYGDSGLSLKDKREKDSKTMDDFVQELKIMCDTYIRPIYEKEK